MLNIIVAALALLPASCLADAPISNLHEVTPRIWRSARPGYDGLAALQAQGLKTVVNLENDPAMVAQESQWASSLGLGFYSKPMNSFQPVDDNETNEILGILTDPSQSKILVHCMGGRDRTGLIIGLYRVLVEHWQPQDAYSEMVYFGFNTTYQDLVNNFVQRTGWHPFSLGEAAQEVLEY